MNMVTNLMSAALKSAGDQAIPDSLSNTAHALIEISERLKTHRLPVALKSKSFVCSTAIDHWSLPDAVWVAMCYRKPLLNCYPMGEVAERAVKKTLITLTTDNLPLNVARARPKSDQADIQQKLRRSLRQLGQNGLLRLLLSHYFFEVCIDYLRRPSPKTEHDWSYGYHFTKAQRMVSVKVERKWRVTLSTQCDKLSARFFPTSIKGKENPARVEERIRNSFAKIFGLPLPQLKAELKPTVNVIVGTRALAELQKSYTVSKKKKRFLLDSPDNNISFSLDVLEDWIGRPFHPLVKDLLEIGVTVHMSDLFTRRGRDLGRKLGVVMPVRHPDLWSDVRGELERTVSSLGRDDFSIYFNKRKQPSASHSKFQIKTDKRCVCLFSGGIDSVSGAVWALDNGLTPVLISHYAINQLTNIQKPLISQLERIYKGKLGRSHKLHHISFLLAKSKKKKGRYLLGSQPDSIMAQHLRSFLFLSVAAAIALESGIGKIYVFENGPVAMNPLFSEARVNTRTVHPHFLANFRSLIKAVFGVELHIENPFAYMTKGEVTSILARTDLRELLAHTSSCWNWFRVNLIAHNKGIKGFKGHHDGDCFPCVHRRTSTHRANLWDRDDEYLIDVFKSYPKWTKEMKLGIADYLRFCRTVLTLSASELLRRAPEFSIYDGTTEPLELMKMYRAHAREVIRCFKTRSNNAFRRDFASVLKM